MDPMHAAVSRRRAKHLDMSPVLGQAQEHSPDGHLPNHKEGLEPSESKGDLAPDGEVDGAAGADHMALERQAMHSHMDQKLQGAVQGHELHNPEHQPIPRGGLAMDALGHEELGHDAGFEHLLQGAHNPTLQKPKTLAARVAAEMHSKKGKA